MMRMKTMNDISPLTDKAKLIEVILFIENGPLTVDRIKEIGRAHV